jgi:hypothetical protein
VLCNGEEVYQGEERSEDDEDEDEDELESSCSSEEDLVAELDKISEDMMSEWYPADVKPVRKGTYECELIIATWPWPAVNRFEWTGRVWKDSEGKTVKGIKQWRGLAEDPDKLVVFECECVQCDWSGPIDDTHDEDGEMRCPMCGEPVELK